MNRVKISWTCSSVQQARPLRRVREFKSEHEQAPWNQLAASIKYNVVAGVFTLKGLGHYYGHGLRYQLSIRIRP